MSYRALHFEVSASSMPPPATQPLRPTMNFDSAVPALGATLFGSSEPTTCVRVNWS
jgi:hypothetical protein